MKSHPLFLFTEFLSVGGFTSAGRLSSVLVVEIDPEYGMNWACPKANFPTDLKETHVHVVGPQKHILVSVEQCKK